MQALSSSQHTTRISTAIKLLNIIQVQSSHNFVISSKQTAAMHAHTFLSENTPMK